MELDIIDAITNEISGFFTQPNAYRSVLILLASLLFAFWVSRFIAHLIIRITRVVALRADSAPDEESLMRFRRLETYMGIVIASVRVVVVLVVGYLAWVYLSPGASSQVAAIGAGAVFIVFAGATLGVLLRDITAGSAMIAERWFNVGDYIRVEPFIDLGGVVERVTLRSTKLRSLNGEVIRLHNQHIHGVRVTPRGIRTIAVDLFVSDRKLGEQLVLEVIDTIPTGTLMITKKPKIHTIDQWGDDLWRIIIYGYTAPGREWLMEQYFVESIKDRDSSGAHESILARSPIVRMADTEAERNFKRAVRVASDETSE